MISCAALYILGNTHAESTANQVDSVRHFLVSTWVMIMVGESRGEVVEYCGFGLNGGLEFVVGGARYV